MSMATESAAKILITLAAALALFVAGVVVIGMSA